VVAADREQADIRNIAQLRALISRVRPDWIVLTAAYTNVDGSEKTKETPLSPSPGSHLPEPALGGASLLPPQLPVGCFSYVYTTNCIVF